MSEPKELDELAIRMWFMHADLTEAIATHNIVEGILAMRQQHHQYRTRKKRSDANRKRNPKLEDPVLNFYKGDRGNV